MILFFSRLVCHILFTFIQATAIKSPHAPPPQPPPTTPTTTPKKRRKRKKENRKPQPLPASSRRVLASSVYQNSIVPQDSSRPSKSHPSLIALPFLITNYFRRKKKTLTHHMQSVTTRQSFCRQLLTTPRRRRAFQYSCACQRNMWTPSGPMMSSPAGDL